MKKYKLILPLALILLCGCQPASASPVSGGKTPPSMAVSSAASSLVLGDTPGKGAEELAYMQLAYYPFREGQEERDISGSLTGDLALTLVQEKAEATSGYPVTYAQQEKIVEQTRESLFLFWLDASTIKMGWDDVGVYELNGRLYYRTRLYSLGEDFGHWVGDVESGIPWIWKGPDPPFSLWQAPMPWQGNSEQLSTENETALPGRLLSFLAETGEPQRSGHNELRWISNHYLFCCCATPETCKGKKCSAVRWYGYDPGSGEVWRDEGGAITLLGTLP